MDKKIKIGLFNDSFFPMIDGVVNVVDNYAKRLVNYADVTVFVPEYSRQKFDDSCFNYKVVRCSSVGVPRLDYSLPTPQIDLSFRSELRNIDLDIVHIHSPFTLGMMGISYAKKHDLPLVATMHSQHKQDFLRAVKSESFANLLTKFMIEQYDQCDECWAVNAAIADLFYNDYHCKTMPGVMNNASDMTPIEDTAAARALINSRHNLSDDETVFLFVGRINKLKNIYFLTDSLKILKEKYGFKFKMLFVGSGQDEEHLRHLIKKDGMEREIIMCGRVTDRDLLAAYYARADLFLFPSLYDASSIVQIEAASQKTPTLFVEGALTAATATNGVDGYIAPNDREKYADKIFEIMSDKAAHARVSQKAFENIYISWDDAVKKVFDEYLRLIENKKLAK